MLLCVGKSFEGCFSRIKEEENTIHNFEEYASAVGIHVTLTQYNVMVCDMYRTWLMYTAFPYQATQRWP